MTLKHRILQLIAVRPDLTEAEIAEHLFGAAGYQQLVNPVCRQLVGELRVERCGKGRPSSPYRYRRRGIAQAG